MTYQWDGHWYASWQGDDGRRKNRRCPNKRLADQLEARMRRRAWEVRAGLVSRDELRRIEVAGTDIVQAASRWRDALIERGRTRSHAREMERAVKHAAKLAGIVSVGEIHDEAIIRLRAALVDDGRTERTCRLYEQALRGVHQFILRPQLRYGSSVRRESRALTIGEVVNAIRACRQPRHAAYIVLAVLTGLRPEEIRRLDASFIDRARGTIELPAALVKNRRGGTMPIDRRVIRIIERYGWPGPPALRTWQRILKRAGVGYADDRGHIADLKCLRKTYGTWLSAAGVNDDVCRMLMRHGGFGGARLTVTVYRDGLHLIDRLRQGLDSLLAYLRRERAIARGHQSAHSARDRASDVIQCHLHGRRTA